MGRDRKSMCGIKQRCEGYELVFLTIWDYCSGWKMCYVKKINLQHSKLPWFFPI